MDEATFTLGGNMTRYGWGKKGVPRTAPAILSRKKKHAFGVLSQDDMYFMFYDAMNAATLIRFLERVRKRFGPVLIFMDNASWHKTKAVLDYVAGCGDIRLEYLPPYTPELNPIETEWRTMRDAMGNRVYKSLSGMVKSVRTMVRRKEIGRVALSRYLMR